MDQVNTVTPLADVLRQPKDESAFRDFYRAWSQITGINPNPDDPRHLYDYRAAFRAGATPQPDPTDAGRYHWPSPYKALTHPNRYVGGVDTITGQPQSVPAQTDILTWLQSILAPRTGTESPRDFDVSAP